MSRIISLNSLGYKRCCVFTEEFSFCNMICFLAKFLTLHFDNTYLNGQDLISLVYITDFPKLDENYKIKNKLGRPVVGSIKLWDYY